MAFSPLQPKSWGILATAQTAQRHLFFDPRNAVSTVVATAFLAHFGAGYEAPHYMFSDQSQKFHQTPVWFDMYSTPSTFSPEA